MYFGTLLAEDFANILYVWRSVYLYVKYFVEVWNTLNSVLELWRLFIVWLSFMPVQQCIQDTRLLMGWLLWVYDVHTLLFCSFLFFFFINPIKILSVWTEVMEFVSPRTYFWQTGKLLIAKKRSEVVNINYASTFKLSVHPQSHAVAEVFFYMYCDLPTWWNYIFYC